MKNLTILTIILAVLIVLSGCAMTHYGRGVDYLQQQKYSEAIGSFKIALDENPEYQAAHTQLGIAYYQTEMYEQAISEFKTAINLQNRDKKARLFSGLAYLKDGRMDDATTEWNTYLDMFPYDNVSEQLEKSLKVLKSGGPLPETVVLITDGIEERISHEERIREMEYYNSFMHYRYNHHFYRYHGYYPCD